MDIYKDKNIHKSKLQKKIQKRILNYSLEKGSYFFRPKYFGSNYRVANVTELCLIVLRNAIINQWN